MMIVPNETKNNDNYLLHINLHHEKEIIIVLYCLPEQPYPRSCMVKAWTNAFLKNWETIKPLLLLVTRGGIELPTHIFSVRFKLLLLNFIGQYELLLIL